MIGIEMEVTATRLVRIRNGYNFGVVDLAGDVYSYKTCKTIFEMNTF